MDIESIDAEHVNISIYSPLSGSSYTELSDKVRNSKKGDINIKNNNNKCFLWCHIGHLNPLKIHPKKNNKSTQKLDPDYKDIGFPVSKNYYQNDLVHLVYLSDKKFKSCMDLLLITNKIKSHYVYIKYFNRFMCNKTKNKNKKHF